MLKIKYNNLEAYVTDEELQVFCQEIPVYLYDDLLYIIGYEEDYELSLERVANV